MLHRLARDIYNSEGTQQITKKLGIDYQIRRFNTRLEEFLKDDKEMVIDGVSVTLSGRTYRKVENELESGAEGIVLTDILSNIDENDVFWDVGADKGVYSCPVAKILPAHSVVAFEPHPIRRGELKRNIARNSLSIILRTEALSHTEGTAQLEYGLKKNGENGDLVANLVPGDKISNDKDIPSPTVIKIDVEGAELDVIRGLSDTLSKDACSLVYVELHNNISDFGGTWEEVKDFLRDRDFEVDIIAERSSQQFLKAEK